MLVQSESPFIDFWFFPLTDIRDMRASCRTESISRLGSLATSFNVALLSSSYTYSTHFFYLSVFMDVRNVFYS
jgi:hypothetical protein